MHRHPAVLLVGPLKLRELRHPQETVLILVAQSQLLSQFHAQSAQNGPYDLLSVSRKQQQVARLRFQSVADRLHLVFGHELREGRLHRAVFVQRDPGKPLCAVPLGKIGKGVDLLS